MLKKIIKGHLLKIDAAVENCFVFLLFLAHDASACLAHRVDDLSAFIGCCKKRHVCEPGHLL